MSNKESVDYWISRLKKYVPKKQWAGFCKALLSLALFFVLQNLGESYYVVIMNIVCVLAELRPNLVYGRPEFSGPPARFFVVHSIDEPHVGNYLGQMTEAA